MQNAWFVIMPAVHIFDVAGPLQTMATCNELDLSDIGIRCTGPEPSLRSFQGLALGGIEPLPPALEPGDVVFVSGSKLSQQQKFQRTSDEAADWLRRVAAATASTTICSVCTGAFVLGRAGLLDGRRCTTHHRYTEALQQACPAAYVVNNRIFVEDGPICTSAGVSTGVDLALHIIGKHFGRRAATTVAQELVLYRRRGGDDPQLSAWLASRNHVNSQIHHVQDFLERDPTMKLDAEQIAERFNISYRHLARLFRNEIGYTLTEYRRRLRIEFAQQLLKESRLTIDQLAEKCGFNSTHAFRAAWKKRQKLAPLEYRNSVERPDGLPGRRDKPYAFCDTRGF